jgi:hypothetical protein
MFRVASLFAAVLLTAPAAFAQAQKAETPGGPPPVLVYVSGVDRAQERIAVDRIVTVVVPVTLEQQVIRNGVPMRVPVTVMQTQTRAEKVHISLKGGSFQTAAGEKLSRDEAFDRLRAGVTVVRSADGRPVDSLYLRAFTPDTLVLVIPPDGAGIQGPAPVAPVAIPGPPPPADAAPPAPQP